jgi:hypothetical protein
MTLSREKHLCEKTSEDHVIRVFLGEARQGCSKSFELVLYYACTQL